MIKDELIIRLIQQDFKHLQLILEMQQIGFEDDGFHVLNILDVILDILEVEKVSPLIDDIYDIYYGFNKVLLEIPISFESEELIPIATACFQKIKERCAIRR
jgi:hypothetical protein